MVTSDLVIKNISSQQYSFIITIIKLDRTDGCVYGPSFVTSSLFLGFLVAETLTTCEPQVIVRFLAPISLCVDLSVETVVLQHMRNFNLFRNHPSEGGVLLPLFLLLLGFFNRRFEGNFLLLFTLNCLFFPLNCLYFTFNCLFFSNNSFCLFSNFNFFCELTFSHIFYRGRPIIILCIICYFLPCLFLLFL